MSLISDALKKAGTSSPVSSGPSPKSRWMPGVLLLGFLVVGISLLARTPQRPAKDSAVLPKAQLQASTLSSQPLSIPLLRRAESQWRLNGIVRGGDGRALALINNQVIEEGGSVEGARVIRVAQDQVDLETEGQIKTLTLR